MSIFCCARFWVSGTSNDTSRHRISFWLSKFILLSWVHFTLKSLETCMGFTEVLEVLFPSLLACRVANKFNFVLNDRAEKSQWRLDAQKKTNNLTNLKINSTISSFFSGPLSFLIKYNLESCCFSCFSCYVSSQFCLSLLFGIILNWNSVRFYSFFMIWWKRQRNEVREEENEGAEETRALVNNLIYLFSVQSPVWICGGRNIEISKPQLEKLLLHKHGTSERQEKQQRTKRWVQLKPIGVFHINDVLILLLSFHPEFLLKNISDLLEPSRFDVATKRSQHSL